jgi:hypothetical protein
MSRGDFKRVVALKPCPFCGAELVKRAHSAFHPSNACWLAALESSMPLELGEHEYPSWNLRIRSAQEGGR